MGIDKSIEQMINPGETRSFKKGEQVSVQRTSGEMELEWTVEDVTDKGNIIVAKPHEDGKQVMRKEVPFSRLIEWNPESASPDESKESPTETPSKQAEKIESGLTAEEAKFEKNLEALQQKGEIIAQLEAQGKLTPTVLQRALEIAGAPGRAIVDVFALFDKPGTGSVIQDTLLRGLPTYVLSFGALVGLAVANSYGVDNQMVTNVVEALREGQLHVWRQGAAAEFATGGAIVGGMIAAGNVLTRVGAAFSKLGKTVTK